MRAIISPMPNGFAHVVVGPGIQQPHLLLFRDPEPTVPAQVGVVPADGLQDLDAIPVRQAGSRITRSGLRWRYCASPR